eukprot:7085190-Alexandrium_andersonii.AAC.1
MRAESGSPYNSLGKTALSDSLALNRRHQSPIAMGLRGNLLLNPKPPMHQRSHEARQVFSVALREITE